MSSQSLYKQGIRSENKVIDVGWGVIQPAINRCVANLKCINSHGTTHYIRVKSMISPTKIPYIYQVQK